MITAAFDQTQFRFRNDDGTEVTATWRQSVNVDDTQDTSTTYRVRFTVEETAGGAANNKLWQAEISLNGAARQDVTTSSSVVIAVNSQLTEGNDCTQIISSSTFISTNNGQSEDGEAGGGGNDYAGSDKGEYEFSYQIVDGDVSDTDDIDIRIFLLNAYTSGTANITVNKPAAAARRVMVVS